MDEKEEKPKPKIGPVFAIGGFIFFLILDALDEIPAVGDIDDIPQVIFDVVMMMTKVFQDPGQQRAFMVVNGAVIILRAIPVVQEIPLLRTAAWCFVLWMDRHPSFLASKIQAGARVVGGVAKATKAGGEAVEAFEDDKMLKATWKTAVAYKGVKETGEAAGEFLGTEGGKERDREAEGEEPEDRDTEPAEEIVGAEGTVEQAQREAEGEPRESRKRKEENTEEEAESDRETEEEENNENTYDDSSSPKEESTDESTEQKSARVLPFRSKDQRMSIEEDDTEEDGEQVNLARRSAA